MQLSKKEKKNKKRERENYTLEFKKVNLWLVPSSELMYCWLSTECLQNSFEISLYSGEMEWMDAVINAGWLQ